MDVHTKFNLQYKMFLLNVNEEKFYDIVNNLQYKMFLLNLFVFELLHK